MSESKSDALPLGDAPFFFVKKSLFSEYIIFFYLLYSLFYKSIQRENTVYLSKYFGCVANGKLSPNPPKGATFTHKIEDFVCKSERKLSKRNCRNGATFAHKIEDFVCKSDGYPCSNSSYARVRTGRRRTPESLSVPESFALTKSKILCAPRVTGTEKDSLTFAHKIFDFVSKSGRILPGHRGFTSSELN